MILHINPQNPEPEKISQAVAILQNGGVILYPTDTIYGLGCDIFNKKAVEKIYQIKNRDKRKPMSILCSDLKQVSNFAILSNTAFQLLKKTLPGPYTYILPAKNTLPRNIIAKAKTVGVRIPDNKICLAIAEKLGPIITTSLNISGEEILASPNELSKEIANKIDLIIDAGILAQEPSTIIDLSGPEPIVLRKGKGDISFLK